MTLREDIQKKLMMREPTYRTILQALKSNDLARAISVAEGFKTETLALLGSIIDERPAEFRKTLKPDQINRMEPEDFLVTTVTVSRAYISPFQTAMRRSPNTTECQRILNPMACAEHLLKAALSHVPEDAAVDLESTTIDFSVE